MTKRCPNCGQFIDRPPSSIRRRLVVDYTKTRREIIDEGQYDEFPTALKFSRPVRGIGVVVCRAWLVQLPFRKMSLDRVTRYLEQYRLKCAGIEELLALGAMYPDLQREWQILCLGSLWWRAEGDDTPAALMVAFLTGDISRRQVVAAPMPAAVNPSCRVLAVPQRYHLKHLDP